MNHVRSFCTVSTTFKNQKFTKDVINKLRHCLIFQLATAGEYIYAIGGHSANYTAGTAISTVERYDPKMNNWIALANISAKGIVGAAGIGKSIFVVG